MQKEESKYKSLSEWKLADPEIYTFAQKKGLLKNACEKFGWKLKTIIRKPSGYWTFERCEEDALRYKTKKEWEKESRGAYKSALKNKWFYKCCSHMIEVQKPNGYWTFERCEEDALRYKTKKEWEKESKGALYKARSKGWFDVCCLHMNEIKKPNGYWTLERCKSDALKYKTKKEWRENSSAAYKATYKKSWFDVCCLHMNEIKKPNGYWTLERCKSDALKYKTKKEWRENSSAAYQYVYSMNWFDKCCTHMISVNAKRKV